MLLDSSIPPRLKSQKALAPIVIPQGDLGGAVSADHEIEPDDLTPLDRFRRAASKSFGTPGMTPQSPFDAFETSPFRRQRSPGGFSNDGFGSTAFGRQRSGGSKCSDGSFETGNFNRQRTGESNVSSHCVRPSLGPDIRTCRLPSSIKSALIVDWDDTLFPTTWIREDCNLDWRQDLHEQLKPGIRTNHIKECLKRYVEHAEALLKEAASRATQVVIVTLAQRDWVTLSVKRFCPTLLKTLEECKAKIIYAQEYADSDGSSRTQCEDETEERHFWTDVKASAIRVLLNEEGMKWTDVLSIGDSEFERQGTKQVCDELNKNGKASTRLHTKVLKSLESPTIEELIAQHSVFERWLPYIIDLNGDLDIEIDTSDDDLLNDLDKLVTGRICSCGADFLPDSVFCLACDAQRPRGPAVNNDEELSWTVLAGMDQETSWGA